MDRERERNRRRAREKRRVSSESHHRVVRLYDTPRLVDPLAGKHLRCPASGVPRPHPATHLVHLLLVEIQRLYGVEAGFAVSANKRVQRVLQRERKRERDRPRKREGRGKETDAAAGEGRGGGRGTRARVTTQFFARGAPSLRRRSSAPRQVSRTWRMKTPLLSPRRPPLSPSRCHPRRRHRRRVPLTFPPSVCSEPCCRRRSNILDSSSVPTSR